ncbi:virulence protein RhuM/Fic/DOC family protein [Candidatus Uhrbacteria bacterium]|nr:virulence protein RhuM/Fic/DOC family protein [Candidatus Uhrbacteria bacterium]
MEEQKNIIIYRSKDGQTQIDVTLEKDTVWLRQAQIASLFDTQRPAITKHLGNIFESGELDEKSVCSILEHTATDGKKYKTQYYNLDAVISVGYRVNSQRATQFRIWATRTLKDHLIKGYTINEKRLIEERAKLHDLQTAIAFLQKKSKHEMLVGQAGEILDLLRDYSSTLSLLLQYDKGELASIQGKKTASTFTHEESRSVITQLRKNLIEKKEAGDLFGNERDGSFGGIIAGLYQTFGGKELYPTIESKAAHLLYFTIKDHSFSDGNKRIGSFLFVYFLDKAQHLFRANGERKINDNALTALALLVAASDPKEKEIMLKLIMSLLA